MPKNSPLFVRVLRRKSTEISEIHPETTVFGGEFDRRESVGEPSEASSEAASPHEAVLTAAEAGGARGRRGCGS